MVYLTTFALAFGISFCITFIFTHFLIPYLLSKNISGIDGHKPDKPKIPEMGGISIVVGYTLGILAVLSIGENFDPTMVFAGLLVFIFASVIGFSDDLWKLSHKIKPVLLLAAAAPLVILGAGKPEIVIGPYTVDFSFFPALYWLIIVPLGVTGAANVTNMLAGFNGLMSGLGIVSCGFMTVIALYLGQTEAAILLSTMVGAQLAFLHFSKFPARIFPGDTGTLGLGALMASAMIIGNFELLGLICLVPLIFNASISLLSVGGFFEEKQFRKEKLSAFRLTDDGLLSYVKLEKPITLSKILLYNKPQKEYVLVFKLILLSIIANLIALGLAWVWW